MLRQHLGQCGVCREEYQVRRELPRLKAEGKVCFSGDTHDT